jgi:hypothetical protein
MVNVTRSTIYRLVISRAVTETLAAVRKALGKPAGALFPGDSPLTMSNRPACILRPMPSQLGPAHRRRPPLMVEVEHELVLVFRREAAKREVTVPTLIHVHDLLDVIATDKLVTAILDN